MERIEIMVTKETAKKWQDISPKIRARLEQSFEQQIEDLARRSKIESFDELLKDIREEAEANGLTEEILQEILKEDE